MSVCGIPIPVSYTHLDVYKRQPKAYPVPYSKRGLVQEEINKMLAEGIIERKELLNYLIVKRIE